MIEESDPSWDLRDKQRLTAAHQGLMPFLLYCSSFPHVLLSPAAFNPQVNWDVNAAWSLILMQNSTLLWMVFTSKVYFPFLNPPEAGLVAWMRCNESADTLPRVFPFFPFGCFEFFRFWSCDNSQQVFPFSHGFPLFASVKNPCTLFYFWISSTVSVHRLQMINGLDWLCIWL